MKRVWKRVLIGSSVTLVVLVGSIGYLYARLAAPCFEQYNQLKQLVENHDIKTIKALSADRETERFLLSLPKDSTVNASDFQGGGPVGSRFVVGYFPGEINGKFINTFMSTKTGFQFIPHWKLIKISIKNTSINPNWVNHE